MVVVVMGSIDGFMASGFIGIFLAAVTLASGHKLFMVSLGGGDHQRRPGRRRPGPHGSDC